MSAHDELKRALVELRSDPALDADTREADEHFGDLCVRNLLLSVHFLAQVGVPLSKIQASVEQCWIDAVHGEAESDAE